MTSIRARALQWLAAGLLLSTPLVVNTISQWESSGETVLVAYADQLAGGLPTVCDGLTRHVTSTPIIVGARWTLEQCEREQTAARERVQMHVLGCFTRLPPQTVFDMASSHAWNFGAGTTCGSAAMAAWNRGEWELGCRRLQWGDDGRPVWSFVRTGRTLPNGKPEYRFVQGLANRRADEHAKCLSGVTR